MNTVEGIQVKEQSGFTLVQVSTWGSRSAASAAIGATFDVEAPLEPGRVAVGDHTSVFWFGPSAWLIRRSGTSPGIPAQIEACTLVDISDSRRSFRLEGQGVVELLSTGCPLDFQAERHAPGRCAHTPYNQFQSFVHRLTESAFDLYVPRSYADDFLIAVSSATADAD